MLKKKKSFFFRVGLSIDTQMLRIHPNLTYIHEIYIPSKLLYYMRIVRVFYLQR